MKMYKTSEIAKIIGIHPNTVRLYEEFGLISKPERKPNGYRVFTELHVEQFRLARLALKNEITQNGLRKMTVEIIKTVAAGSYDCAIDLTEYYIAQITASQRNAEEAIEIVQRLLSGNVSLDNESSERQDNSKGKCDLTFTNLDISSKSKYFTRKEAAEYLQISIDMLRNWELNGLITVKRKVNGYRIYNEEDIQKIKIIRILRLANYSLTAILRMLNSFSKYSEINIREVIDTPKETEDIISVCDRLLTSLVSARKDADEMLSQIKKMKKQFI